MGNPGALWVARLTKTLSFKFIKRFYPNKIENKTGKTPDMNLRIPYTYASIHMQACKHASMYTCTYTCQIFKVD